MKFGTSLILLGIAEANTVHLNSRSLAETSLILDEAAIQAPVSIAAVPQDTLGLKDVGRIYSSNATDPIAPIPNYNI